MISWVEEDFLISVGEGFQTSSEVLSPWVIFWIRFSTHPVTEGTGSEVDAAVVTKASTFEDSLLGQSLGRGLFPCLSVGV